MRVLTTNSLILAAITLAPSVSAAPHTGSSVDSYESYSNLAALAQDPGPSSIPSMLYTYGQTINLSRHAPHLDVRRDEAISAESLYDTSPFGTVFKPIADLFNNIGMNSISSDMPLTEEQEKVLGTLHEKLVDAVSRMPSGLPLPAPASRSLQENQLVDPPAPLDNLNVVGDPITRLLQTFTTLGIEENPTTPLNDVQKSFIQKLGTAIDNVVQDATSVVPKPDVMPLDHARAVEERSLQNIIANIGEVPFISLVLGPVTGLLRSLGIMDGEPLNDVQKQALSKVEDKIAEAVQKAKEEASTVHIEHTREEHEDCDHHDGHHSHDEHKRDSEPHGAHKNSHKFPDTQSEDRHTDGSDKGGDHCREPRDRQWDGGDDCGRYNNGKDRNEGSSLLKISLGNSRHP